MPGPVVPTAVQKLGYWLNSMTYSEWKTLPPADQYRFYVSAVCKAAKALLGSDEGSHFKQ